MRADISLFVRPGDVVIARSLEGEGVLIVIETPTSAGADMRIFFGSMVDAERLADAIFHLKMDRNEEAMQAASPGS